MKLEEIVDFDEFIYHAIYSTFPTEYEVDAIEQLFRLYSGILVKKILDIGCGFGRHAFELARRGYHVDGFDLAENRIKRAQSHSKGNPCFIVGDMLGNPFEGPYDAAIAMYSTIGSLVEISGFIDFLNNVHNKIKMGGLFISDYFYPTNLVNSGNYRKRLVIEWDVHDLHMRKESTHWLDMKNQIHQEDTVYTLSDEESQKVFRNQEMLRYYEPVQIVQLFTDIGFQQIYLYDRKTYRKINNYTTGILVVARK